MTKINIFLVNIHLRFIPRLNRISYLFFTNEHEIAFKGTVLLSQNGNILDNNIILEKINPAFKFLCGKIEKNIVSQMNDDICIIFNKLQTESC